MAPPPRPKQLDSPLLPKIFKYMSRAQVWVYRRTRGRIGGKWRVGAGFRKPVPVLLLDHRGRKSGRLFTIPVLYAVDGDDLLIVASQGGLEAHPQWYLNLRAAPETSVQIGGSRRTVHARVAEGAERTRRWRTAVEAYADFDTYQSWATREIPLVVLEPR